ncbi:hypothetical protein AYP77_08930 [Lactobacillus crispatus]|nr:hypothetical protein AYP77_08930 [Lactobacillus crispatus]
MCFFVQTNHTRKELLFLMFKEINLRNHSSLHKLFYGLLFTKTNIRNGINHHSIKTTELTYIIIGLLNFKVQDEIQLGKRNNKVDLQEYATSWIDKNLYSNSPLVKQLTIQLRNTLDLDHSNKKELRQIALRGLISVL